MKDSIKLGKDKYGGVIRLPIDEPPRLGILGSSGSGKSVLTQNIILCMAKAMENKVQFVGIDPKIGSLSAVKDRFCRPIVSNPVEFLPLMQDLTEEMERRYVVMAERGLEKLDPDRDGDEFPMIMFIAEELCSITNNADIPRNTLNAIQDWFTTYLSRARAANLGAIVISHTFSSTDAIRPVARDQLKQRIGMKSTEQNAKTFIEGEIEMAPVWLINKPGEFYYSDGDYNKWVKGSTAYPGEKAVRQYAAEFSGDVRPFGSTEVDSDVFDEEDW